MAMKGVTPPQAARFAYELQVELLRNSSGQFQHGETVASELLQPVLESRRDMGQLTRELIEHIRQYCVKAKEAHSG